MFVVASAGAAEAAAPAEVDIPAFASIVAVDGAKVEVGRGKQHGFAARGAVVTGWPREPLGPKARPPSPLALEGPGGGALRGVEAGGRPLGRAGVGEEPIEGRHGM